MMSMIGNLSRLSRSSIKGLSQTSRRNTAIFQCRKLNASTKTNTAQNGSKNLVYAGLAIGAGSLAYILNNPINKATVGEVVAAPGGPVTQKSHPLTPQKPLDYNEVYKEIAQIFAKDHKYDGKAQSKLDVDNVRLR